MSNVGMAAVDFAERILKAVIEAVGIEGVADIVLKHPDGRKALLRAQYAGNDAVADAAEDAKYGKVKVE
jgi:hypothetical protein